ncbi:MAG: hypothetical protein NC299_04980 [Lachnospiraceae bacterium]|nr:hypothetical protein [Ruminococcus sp.]MCM1274704.1 hypothetical protein [Lachnospiraceae bacterium]
MKKILVIVSVMVCVFCALGVTAFADCGPKASLTVSVKGAEEGREYYLTLLSEFDHRYNDKFIKGQPPEWRAMYEFALSDEYNLWNSPVDSIYYKMTGSGTRTWGYMPPDKFKILLYYPDDNTFILSEKLERYAFSAYFTADISGGAMTVAKNGGAAGVSVEVGGFILRVVVTVLIEAGVARLFGCWGRRAYMLIIIMNVCTQVFLNIMIAVGDMNLGGLGAVVAYIFAEIIVFTVEAAVYSAKLPRLTENQMRRTAGYAFAANAASFFVGGILMIFGEMFYQAIVYN